MGTVTTAMVDHLIEAAEATYAPYPQYAGHWDGWVLAVAKRPIRCHGKQVVDKGEAVLFDPTSRRRLVDFDEDPKSLDATFNKRLVGVEFGTFYLPKNCGGCDTSLRTDYFTIEEA